MTTGARPRAVFLDRDGTLIVDAGYPRDPEQVRLLPGAVEALAELRREGFHLILVSNQSGVGRGLVTADEAERVHERLLAVLAAHGVRLDAWYYCPHAPEAGCRCRKPAPEMLLRAADRLGLDLASSFMVGDKPSDVEAGQRAGCRSLLLAADPPPDAPSVVAADWPAVVRYITSHR